MDLEAKLSTVTYVRLTTVKNYCTVQTLVTYREQLNVIKIRTVIRIDSNEINVRMGHVAKGSHNRHLSLYFNMVT